MIGGPLVLHALGWGAGLSAVLGGLIVGSLYLNPEIWLRRFPEPLRALYGPERRPESLRQRKLLGWVSLAALVGVLAGALVSAEARFGELSFLAAFVYAYVLLDVFNLVDLVLIDWLLVVVMDPKWLRLPGLEEEPSHQTYWTHFRGFLIGSVVIAVPALLFAAVAQAV